VKLRLKLIISPKISQDFNLILVSNGSHLFKTNFYPNAIYFDFQESETARELKIMLLALGFPKPPDNISSLQLFEKVS